jgi:hypothetical protein
VRSAGSRASKYPIAAAQAKKSRPALDKTRPALQERQQRLPRATRPAKMAMYAFLLAAAASTSPGASSWQRVALERGQDVLGLLDGARLPVLSALNTDADLSTTLWLVDASTHGVNVLGAATYHPQKKRPRHDLVALEQLRGLRPLGEVVRHAHEVCAIWDLDCDQGDNGCTAAVTRGRTEIEAAIVRPPTPFRQTTASKWHGKNFK